MQHSIEYLTLLLSILIAFNVENAAAANQHSVKSKSIRSTDKECQLYLPNDSSNCSIRCRGLLNRFWDDRSGLGYYSIARFYQPNPEDTCYQNRTGRCFAGISATDSCRRAKESVKCFNDQYGQLDSGAVRFVPFTKLQHIRIVRECAAMLGMSEEDLKKVAINGSEIPRKACLLRCFLIRHGLYSDNEGFDLKRIELQCGGYEGNWNPKKIRKCADGVQDCDKCSKVLRIADECVNLYFLLKPYSGVEIYKSIPYAVDFLVELTVIVDIEFVMDKR